MINTNHLPGTHILFCRSRLCRNQTCSIGEAEVEKFIFIFYSHQATGTLIPRTILAFLQCGQGGHGAGGGGGGTVTGGEGTVRGTKNGTMECVTPILEIFIVSSSVI